MPVRPAPLPHHALARLLGLAWPLIVSRSSQAVIGFVDAAMAGQLGQDALAATTTGALDAFSLLILPMGLVFIVSSFSSQLAGAGDPGSAQRYGHYGLIVAAVSELLCLAIIPLTPLVLTPLGYEPHVTELIVTYLAWRLPSGGPAVGLEALSNLYGGLGNTRLPMLASLLAMVLNVPLNWVFIFGHCGVPAMGVAGAALASSLATTIAFAALLWCFLAGIGLPGGRVSTPLRMRELYRVVRFGLPNGLNWFFENLAFAFFVNVVVADLGTASVAAFMTVMQLNGIAFMPAFGLASAGAIVVGEAIGARHHDQVPRLVRRTLVVAAGWQSLVGLAYLFAPTTLMGIFTSSSTVDAELVAVGARMLAVSVAWQVFDASASVLSEALRAAGDTTFCLVARLAVAWLVFVPGSLLSVHWGAGETVVTAWLVAYLALLAVALAWRFRRGTWRHIDLTGVEA